MSSALPNTFRSGPDERGHFGIFGGRFVAETLMPLILDLEKAYADAKADPAFQAEMNGYLKNYVGRPSPLYLAERLTAHLGGAKIYFKREELNHTGSHKVNNVLGQIMVARRMGKQRIIAETGAGQHGVATATVCALFGLSCVIYMGQTDIERQSPNVFKPFGVNQSTRMYAVAVATPCCPAPVSAMMRCLPIRRASSACPSALLILCAPVCSRSSRFR